MGVYLLNSRTERRFWWVRPRFNDRIHKALTRPQDDALVIRVVEWIRAYLK
ncbi:hypothetical protein OROGR_034177 [Orobanche gracilis]